MQRLRRQRCRVRHLRRRLARDACLQRGDACFQRRFRRELRVALRAEGADERGYLGRFCVFACDRLRVAFGLLLEEVDAFERVVFVLWVGLAGGRGGRAL